MFDVPPEPLPSHPEPPPDIELVFRPYPKEGAEDKTEESRFIKTTANATGIMIMYMYFSTIYIICHCIAMQASKYLIMATCPAS